MFTRRVMAVFAVVGTLLLMLALGCGPKPPCPVPPGEVKAMQDETAQVESELADTQAQIERMEKELSTKQAELQQLQGKPEDLEKKLENLKKGSGRE
jgi:predicted small lipoprotein YifL